MPYNKLIFEFFQVIDSLHRQRLQLKLKDPDALKSALEQMVSAASSAFEQGPIRSVI